MTVAGDCTIVAEAGVNHDGRLDLALELVRAAKASGADAVKFQTFSADRLVTRAAARAPYQRADPAAAAADDGQHAMLRALELDGDALARVRDLAAEEGVTLVSSPFDERSADELVELGVRDLKVASGEITNLPFLRHVGGLGVHVIVSTGMSTLGEVERAVDALERAGAPRLTLLHCLSAYPAPPEQANLRAMRTLEQAFGLPVGFSDHTAGTAVAIAAAALGARMIEKHLTLDRRRPGPDHAASLEPAAFGAMVRDVHTALRSLGDGRKRPMPAELENVTAVRKSLVASRDLAAGARLAAGDVAAKRPGDGLPPSALDEVLGRTLARPVARDQPLAWEDLR